MLIQRRGHVYSSSAEVLLWLAVVTVALWAVRLATLTTVPARPIMTDPQRMDRLDAVRQQLAPLHSRLPDPQPGDWLYHHPEPGQSFHAWLASRPVLPRGRRRTIHIQPLGDLSPAQQRVVTLTADYIERYFGIPVVTREALDLSVVPPRARRVHPVSGYEQILSAFVLDEVLAPRLPADATAYIAFTASDLWPGAGWNFVFGQASLRDRVGVWSLHRKGDPAAGEQAFRTCLRRTIQTAVHELGHMFSMRHCTAWRCVMNGSNSLPEADRRPLWACPEDLAKVCHVGQQDPIGRYEALAAFCHEHGLTEEEAFFRRSLEQLARAEQTPE